MTQHFHMIDVGHKPTTHRIAVAAGEIHVGASAFTLIRDRKLPKGDALMLAEVAGIQGAKQAHTMIPLCHPMGLDQVRIVTELDEVSGSIRVYCFASTHAKTGVEMEALAGVNSALLTIWDLTKMVEPALTIRNITLLAKRGGKSGFWQHPHAPQWVLDAMNPKPEPVLLNRRVAVVTMSDRAHKGEYEDKSGALLQEMVKTCGATIADYQVIPDETAIISSSIKSLIERHAPDLILCTGGTGVAARDVTPEALTLIFEREIAGVGELLRSDGARYTPLSWSSRSVAGVIGKTLIITLPGNPAAVREGMDALLPDLVPHLIRMIRGEPK